MIQALALVILLVLGAAFYNKYLKPNENPARKSKKGEIIDISEAWISMDNLPYRRKESILNTEELALAQRLRDILPSEYCLLPRVRLADILYLAGNPENRQAYQARINDRAVDFVICSTEEMRPLLIIFAESEAGARKKQIRDGFVRRAVETAGIPSLHIKVDPLPDPEFLTKQINKAGILL